IFIVVLKKIFILFNPAVLMPCHGFSVDTEQPIIFRETVKSFGYSVVQFGSVGAPLQQGGVNETGKMYKCQMALLAPQVCGPRVHQTCGEYIYLKGYCFLLDENLRQIQRFPDQLPGEIQIPADIVFLIDGSGSIKTRQFSQMKTFISEVIKRFQNTNTQFGLSQYSDEYVEHFDFLLFKATPNPDNLIRQIWQLNGATHTATYIQKVVREMFLPEKGARSDASKILIVITDGKKTGDPLQYNDVITEAQRANIIRFAIGVGFSFSQGSARQELIAIASKPSMDYVFSVNNFDALKDIQNNLQNKIFAIEGITSDDFTGISQSFELELSQEGFSALHTQSGSILGAVGAYDWAGGLFLFNSQGDAAFINTSSSTNDLKSAYLGKSHIQTIALDPFWVESFVVGAPRYQHTGKVVWFSQRRGQWMQQSELSLKHDTCGFTCLFFIPISQGETFFCGKELQGEPHHPLGRFGTSIAEAGEITSDQWTDVAVGAPLEDEYQGAVYIFEGKSRTLNHVFSQRIRSSILANRLQYFGQALDGGSELTGDGLPDLAVGADRQVLLLRMYRIKLPTCIEDSLTPIILQLNYTLMGEPIPRANNIRAVLKKDESTLLSASLHFEKNCGRDGICKDQLNKGISPLSFSLNELVVGLNSEINATVFIRNDGEDSYSTNLTFIHPSSLSYRRYIIVKYVILKCTSPSGTEEVPVRNTTCSINHPIFRSMAEVLSSCMLA
uniref:Integrin subunit alpha X n=1 Tax=Naja naja TaxID=35670 RepID=A0A8C7E4B6_NAJNA